MDALLIASTALVLISTCVVVIARSVHLQNRRALIHLRTAQRSAYHHIQKSRMDLMETRNRARLLEDTVKQGTSAVEKMHQAIAATTFGLIDHFAKNEEFRESAQRAHQTHNHTSRKIYQAAHTTNKALHLLADSVITRRQEKKLTARSRPKKPDGQPDDK